MVGVPKIANNIQEVNMLGLAFAMGSPPGGQAAGGQSALMNLVPLIFMFGIFYFLLIRPQQKKAKTTGPF